MSVARICLFSAAALLLGLVTYAQTQAPAQTPPLLPAPGPARQGDLVLMSPIPEGIGRMTEGGPRPSNIRILPPGDHDLFVRAFTAAARGDWPAARSLAAQGHDPLARQLLEWRYVLDKDSGASFAEIDAVMKATRGWPLPGTLQARGEQAIEPFLPAAQVLAWFAGRDPNSSIGNIRLGEALVATGDTTRGAQMIRDGWADGSFDPQVALAIVQKDAQYLTPESDRARLDNLLWRGEYTDARRELSRVDDRSATVALARIALDGGLARARKALAKVRNSQDPGLLFDWSYALRQANNDSGAHAMLMQVNAAPLAKDHPVRWWAEVSVQARDALNAGDPRTALRLVTHAGFTAGDQYAEQQFLGGFIELHFLHNASSALAWFQRLEAAVARPISRARAHYWQGRAYEQMGDTANAIAQYRQAAASPETFYGQIALARIDPTPQMHLAEAAIETAPPVELDGDVLMPQIKTLADLGQENAMRFFVNRDVELNPSPGHVKRMMLSLWDWGYPEVALRLAKAQSYAGLTMPDMLFPVIPLPPYKGPGSGPEAAVVLGLIRQETEFDAYAVSSAGARGLAQVMPATARNSARLAGLPYRPGDLLTDTAYNIQLGMIEFEQHISRWNGSLILAIASYNAGPSNAKKWVVANGDPRGPGADPVAWIEQIPFGETRNYVQRVLENTEVYRARVAGRDVPLRIMSDLYAPGNTPPAVPMLAAAN